MRRVLYCLLCILISGCFQQDSSKKNKEQQDSVLSKRNSFTLKDVILSEKNIKDMTNYDLNALDKCDSGYSVLDKKSFFEEYNLINDFLRYFEISNSNQDYLKDTFFLINIYRLITQASTEDLDIQSFVLEEIKQVNIQGYGNCIVIYFRFLSPLSPTQENPLIILNLEKKELILFDFNKTSFDSNGPKVTFKVRNNKKVYYSLKYDMILGRFVPICYKVDK